MLSRSEILRRANNQGWIEASPFQSGSGKEYEDAAKQKRTGKSGMFTYLAQYLPQKNTILTELVKKANQWDWCPEHENAFHEVKNMITKVLGPVFKFFDPHKPVTLQLDASQSG